MNLGHIIVSDGFYLVPAALSVLALMYLPFSSPWIVAVFVWFFGSLFSFFWALFIIENHYPSFYFILHIVVYYLFFSLLIYCFYEDKKR